MNPLNRSACADGGDIPIQCIESPAPTAAQRERPPGMERRHYRIASEIPCCVALRRAAIGVRFKVLARAASFRRPARDLSFLISAGVHGFRRDGLLARGIRISPVDK